MVNDFRDPVDVTFAALADPTRRRVIDVLRDGPRRSSELAAAAGMSRPAMGRHLKVLRASGLVDVEAVEADARGRVYSLRADQFVALQAWLDQVQAFWSEQLGRFKQHAARPRPASGGTR